MSSRPACLLRGGGALDLAATPWRRLMLSSVRDLWCLVDAEDWPWITATGWNYGWHAKTPWKLYAKRNIGPGRSTVYLHREIMLRAEPQSYEFACAHHVDHINGQSLDNRRANLRWTTPAENGRNRMRRMAIPSLDAIVRELIGGLAEAGELAEDVPF